VGERPSGSEAINGEFIFARSPAKSEPRLDSFTRHPATARWALFSSATTCGSLGWVLLKEFQNIMPIVNVPSVLARGILSYDSVAELEHSSIALHDVQERRERTRIPGGLRLHQYANVYFHARNPMMSRRRTEAQKLCVLRV